MRCIHIAPEFPPAVGGVADYATILSRRLMERSDGTVDPALMHAGSESASEIETDFPVVDLSGQTSAVVLAEAIEQLAADANGRAIVLLEYSGYGYAARGAPCWLIRGLPKFVGAEIPLITVFHELQSSGRIWESSFWLAPVQRWIGKQLLRKSHHAFANHQANAEQLREWARTNKVSLQPIFSNVGEPDERVPLEERACRAVMFCGRAEKEKIYDCTDQLARLFEHRGIDHLVDIGPPPSQLPDLDVRCDVLGIQPADAISSWISQARLGLAHRRIDLMTKSGVVAAYLAHGVPPVILPHGTPSHPPALSENMHYVRLGHAWRDSSVNWERMSRNGHAWYQKHAHSSVVAEAVHHQMRTAHVAWSST